MLIIPALLYYFIGKFHQHEDYWKLREDFIKAEKQVEIGYGIELSDKEEAVNKIFLRHKLAECDEGMRYPNKFLAGKHFYNSREYIEQSDVFNFIKELPKGALLHVHDIGMSSYEFLYNVTFWDNLYYCRDKTKGIIYRFFDKPDKSCKWKLLASAHADKELEQEICASLHIFVPECSFNNSHEAWKEFNKVLYRVEGLITYRPVFEKLIYYALELLYNENIMYVEIRSPLTPLYDLKGDKCGPLDVAEIYIDVMNKFKRKHKYFLDAKLVYSPHRNIDGAGLDNCIETAKALKKAYPTFFIGFDLFGEEDAGKPLLDFVNQLKHLDVSAYFHAGETNWYGTSVDRNLIDAVLLGTRRIGGAYGILKHLKVLDAVKENGIAIEVCPLSSQMLYYINDVRYHPGSVLFAHNSPVVIGSDYPGLWGAVGVSYDWYYAIMGMASKDADLRVLKKLAKNSIEYSGMDEKLKKEAYAMWNTLWEIFLDKIISQKWQRKH